MGASLPASRILKTVYFSSRGGRLYGAVVPGDVMVDPAALERVVLDDVWSRHERGDAPRPHYSRLALRKASILPTLMTYGTCSPCISSEDVRSDWRGKPLAGNVGRIVVDIDDETSLFDLPFPGRADVAMHARFSDVHSLLDAYVPGVVIRGKVRAASYSTSYPVPSSRRRVSRGNHYNFIEVP